MTTKEQKIERIEIKKIYVADDGTEFQSEEECKKYEQTARCVINGMFHKLKIQKTYGVGDCEPFNFFGYEDCVYAVKIENMNQVEIVNKWMKSENSCHINESYLGADAVGTIQLLSPFEGGVWVIGTPDELKETYNKAIDNLFVALVEKVEDMKEETI